MMEPDRHREPHEFLKFLEMSNLAGLFLKGRPEGRPAIFKQPPN